jgi:hypothetical protein
VGRATRARAQARVLPRAQARPRAQPAEQQRTPRRVRPRCLPAPLARRWHPSSVRLPDSPIVFTVESTGPRPTPGATPQPRRDSVDGMASTAHAQPHSLNRALRTAHPQLPDGGVLRFRRATVRAAPSPSPSDGSARPVTELSPSLGGGIRLSAGESVSRRGNPSLGGGIRLSVRESTASTAQPQPHSLDRVTAAGCDSDAQVRAALSRSPSDGSACPVTELSPSLDGGIRLSVRESVSRRVNPSLGA